jgi:hypothetical protein
VLKARVSEVWRQTVLRGSPRVTDGSPPQGRMAAFVNHLYDDLARNLFTPAPYLRSFLADWAYYPFRIRTHLRAPRSLPVGWLHATTADGTSPWNHAPDPVAQRHKQWFRTILPQCHALAAQITLTVQKELQMLAVQTGMSAGQLRAAASASKVTGGARQDIAAHPSLRHQSRSAASPPSRFSRA